MWRELVKVAGVGVGLDLSSIVPDSRPGTQRMFRAWTSSRGGETQLGHTVSLASTWFSRKLCGKLGNTHLSQVPIKTFGSAGRGQREVAEGDAVGAKTVLLEPRTMRKIE